MSRARDLADYISTGVSGTELDVLDSVTAGTVTASKALVVDANKDIASVRNVSFDDSGKAIFGAGSDLQIYHDGSNSYVSDQGTGNLNVRGTNLVLGNASGSNSYLAANDGGGVYLYYAGQNKIETTTTGIDVTGTVTADGLTVEMSADGIPYATFDNDFSYVGDGVGLKLRHNGGNYSTIYSYLPGGNDTDLYITTTNSGVSKTAMKISGDNDISFYEDTGTTAKFFWDASAESLGIGTSSPSSYDAEADDVVIASSDHTGLTIASTGTDKRTNLYFSDGTSGSAAYIGGFTYDHSNDNLLTRTGGSERMRIDSSGNLLVGTTTSPSGSNKLFLAKGLVETTTTVSYASSIALTYDNGSIQTVTLTGNVTFTDSLADGEAIVLMLNAGASHTVTFPTMTWVSSGGNAAPTLTANDTIVFWKIGSTLYGAYAGSYT